MLPRQYIGRNMFVLRNLQLCFFAASLSLSANLLARLKVVGILGLILPSSAVSLSLTHALAVHCSLEPDLPDLQRLHAPLPHHPQRLEVAQQVLSPLPSVPAA